MTFDVQADSASGVQPYFDSSGGGAQHNNLGSGNQYNNSGPGTQYNAHSINFVNKEKDNFLANLRVTDPRDDKTRIQRTKGNLLKDSYRWILDHDDFSQWRAEKRLLWIKGGPGKGKTMLLCGVIDELIAMGYDSTFFFFCQAADARLNTATSVLRGLLYLILDQNTAVLDLLRGKYDNAGAGKQLFEDVNSWDVLCTMVLSAIRHESLNDVVLIVDGIDECTSGLDQLTSFIVDLTAHVKVIVSSRPELRIDRGLAAALQDTKIYLSLELNEDAISAAVDNYIRHKVHLLANLKVYDDETTSVVENYLAANADDTFLWVALVCEQLADNRVAKRHTEETLHKFPPGLDSLYERILEQIFALSDAETFRHILAVMSIVYRPLSLAELATLIDHDGPLRDIVEECGSLVTIKADTVYFVHQSAKDYLTRQGNRLVPSRAGANHSLVLSKLLHTMSATLRRNIYGVDNHGITIAEVCTPTPDPLESVRYACVYWADHLMDADDGQGQSDQVYEFLRHHLLHWLEALSLLRSISEGITSISHIQQVFENSAQLPERKRLVRDAFRFIRYFRVPIEIDPTQVYLSALVFSPTKSIIRQQFGAEEPQWPVKPVVDEHWSPFLQTLEADMKKVDFVGFSLDGATLGCWCEDGTIKLWDTTTGHNSRTFNMQGKNSRTNFVMDGATLALAVESYICLWNTMTGRFLMKLLTTGEALSMAFSSDGVMLASGSNGAAVELWDIQNSQGIHTLHGHTSDVVSVTFSGDDSLLASASWDKTARVWQTKTGDCLTIVDHAYQLELVALSNDGTHLTMVSKTALTIMDLTTNDRFDPPGIESQLSEARNIAISRDGTQLAMASRWVDNIHIWNIIANERRGTLRTGGGGDSMQFSKDGNLLASTSGRKVNLWDLTSYQSHGPQSNSRSWADLSWSRRKASRKGFNEIKRLFSFTKYKQKKGKGKTIHLQPPFI